MPAKPAGLPALPLHAASNALSCMPAFLMFEQDEHFSAAHIEEKAESLIHRVEEGAVHVLHRLPLGKARANLPCHGAHLTCTSAVGPSALSAVLG